MVQPSDPSICRSISQDVRRAARHQLPRLTCDRWGTQDLGDGSKLIVICWGYENQSTLASLVRTDPYHPITSHNHIVPRNPFPSSIKDCLVSDRSIDSGFWVLEGIVLVFTHRNLSVFMADALLHCQFLGGVTARTLVVERALQQ